MTIGFKSMPAELTENRRLIGVAETSTPFARYALPTQSDEAKALYEFALENGSRFDDHVGKDG